MNSVVFVLIPCHNNKGDVLSLLGYLERQTYPHGRVVLVDDGSTDGTEDAVRGEFPQVTILKGSGALWWTGANALGVDYIVPRAQTSDFILLLNNDLVVESDYIQRLVEASATFGRAIVGSTLYDFHSRRFVEAGIILDRRLNASINRDYDVVARKDGDDDVSVLPGRGTLIPMEVFSRIGNFNSRRLPHYGADYEFTVRAKRAGFRLIVSHRARVYAKLEITGLACPSGRLISLKECREILFSKKSTANIVYYLTYVWLCSERKWRLRNTITSAATILSSTVGQTIPGGIVKFFFSPIRMFFRKPYVFLFRSYPLRYSDIVQLRGVPRELVRMGILSEYHAKGTTFFMLNEVTDDRLGGCPDETVQRIARLRTLAFSFRHKIEIHWERARNLVLKYRQA